MRRFFVIILALCGLFFVLDATTVAFGIGWGGDVDLDTAGKIEVGVAFAAFGLFLGAGSWMLLHRRRRY
jgi:hypothetical protein